MVSTEPGWLRLAPALRSASVLDHLYSKSDFNHAVLQVITHNRRQTAELNYLLLGGVQSWLYRIIGSKEVFVAVVSDSWQPHGLKPARFLCPLNSPGKNVGVGCCFLLLAVFPTQRLNPGLLHCRQIVYHLSHQENPCLVKINVR